MSISPVRRTYHTFFIDRENSRASFVNSSNGVETELLMYPEDDHALDRPATEADQFINMKLWFDTHL
jgi:hypothetical protein